MMSSTLHRNTPSLAVIDPRGLSLRSVQMSRTTEERPAEIRVTHQRFDPAGRSVARHDPRLFEQALSHLDTPANLHRTFSLSGEVLLVESVDSGWCLTFAGEAGQALERRDGRDSCRVTEYDDLLRPARILEQGRTVERFGYGAADVFEHNQCNQVIRHDDAAGSSFVMDYGVSGAVLDDARSFLLEPVSPDWPLAESGRDALLESDRLHTCRTVNALGEVLEQTDARGNTQRFHQTVAGQLKTVELQQADALQTLVSDIQYNAFNQVEQETAGNGVTSRYVYDPQTGRLNELLATSADGGTLQHLKYVYDPVGNVLEIADPAQRMGPLVRRLVESVRYYRCDTLYQLIEATGFEVKTDTSHGPALPDMQNLPPDPNQIRNYTQTYDYDAAGNLLTMHHVGAQTFTRKMRVAPDSNRSLPEGEVDTDFADSFDANGNLQQLVRGQSLSWNVRNQLQQITTVQRETGLNDEERYVYDGQGQRVRKINSAQASGRTLINEVRYLPGLEIRTTADGEILHVIMAQAGRNGVRVLHWEAGKPEGIANDQVRYSLNDHLGSSTLELDQQGGLISQESYYPFGGTAWWAGRSAVEAKYKTVRYSGKERDASGLYYYGYRYYAPWLQRWINPDPAGEVDGLNVYRMVKNNPTAEIDINGLIGERRGAKGATEASKFHYDHYLVPKIMERKEQNKEHAIASVMKRAGLERANAAGELLDASVGVLESSVMTFNIRPDKLGRLSGKGMINTWKTLKQENSYTEMRDRFENQMFEYGNSTSALVRKASLPGKQKTKQCSRPLYGALQIAPDSQTVGGAPTYGTAAFQLSEDARRYMTFTAADSLSTGAALKDLASRGNVFPLITNMRPDTWEVLNAALNKSLPAVRVTESSSYVEWQSHAPVQWDEMEFLEFARRADFEKALAAPSTLAFIERFSVNVRLKGL